MRYVDVFNGDADGICALLQLQLQLGSPRDSELVTGVKRDIDLLRQVQAGAGDRITVLDVAMEKNRADLDRHLLGHRARRPDRPAVPRRRTEAGAVRLEI